MSYEERKMKIFFFFCEFLSLILVIWFGVVKRLMDTLLGVMPIVVAGCHRVHLMRANGQPHREVVHVDAYRKIRIG